MVKITALTDEPTPVAADLIAIVDDVAGTATTKKATIDNVLAAYDAQTATMTNKTLVSPALGTPSSGVIDNCTGTPTLNSPSLYYAINAQTGTTYTTVLLDAGKIITSSNAATVVITIPPNSSVAYPIGSQLTVVSIGAGLTNFAIGAGVTINSVGATPAAPIITAQYNSATAIKTATDTWVVIGAIS
jgi:hypothetical protein